MEGVILWFTAVLPALFPYLFLTAILSTLKTTSKIITFFSKPCEKFFNVGGTIFYAFFMSLISGYPMGAKITCDLYEKGAINRYEATRAFCFCSTSSPVFTISCVGNVMFKNPLFGVALFIVHLLSSVLVGFIFSFYKRKERPLKTVMPSEKTDNILYESIYSSVISALVVCGFIGIFYLISDVLTSIGILTPITKFLSLITNDDNLSYGVTVGLLEYTKGVKIISNGGISLLTLPFVSALLGFGGISIIMQSVAYIKKAKLKTAPFIIAKLLSAVLSFIIGLIFSLLFFS
jgi:sporulation integral membrane protein YlbJ